MDGLGVDVTGELAGGSGEGKQIRLPKKNMQSEYLLSCLLAIRDMDGVCRNIQRLDDPRPPITARQIINRILDDEIRYKLLDALDKKIEEINNSKDNEKIKSAAIVRASQDAIGEVNSYLDEFFALHKGQLIGDV